MIVACPEESIVEGLGAAHHTVGMHSGGMQSAAHGEDDEDEEETDEEEEMDLDNLSPEDLQALAAYSRKHGMPGMEMDSEEEEEIDSDELDTDEARPLALLLAFRYLLTWTSISAVRFQRTW